MILPLHGKVALVTGGAGGIGSAVCRALARNGASVVVTYNQSAGKAQALIETLAGTGHQSFCAPVDDADALQQLAESVRSHYGKLDILVNNAGITQPVPHDDLEQLTDALIDDIFRVNVRGALATVRALKPCLLASGDALIVNMSSIAARTALGSNIAYCASKAALDNITLSLARALAPHIRVVSVSPGWVNGEYAQRMPTTMLDQQRQRTPLGRIAEAEDVAQAVLAVATHLTFTTGTIIAVDGGRPLL
ncbi:MAG UNVERIFIED_CONTAM: SDR family oxidoreductase [Anaerolineae bacterium]|jgi:3-oxoacyl-[acyl-carrier protein] reductase